MNKKKFILIGLDGGTFDVIDPLIELGALPNIKALKKGGAHGVLESVIPPQTGPAWTAIATGISPWNSGAYSFLMSHKNSWSFTTISSANLRNRAFWDLLAKDGLKTGIWNYPTLYPVYAINGFMVSGILGAQNNDITYPEILRGELAELVGDYKIYIEHSSKKYENKEKKFIKDVDNLLDQNRKVLNYLLDKKDWDVFVGVISASDFIQHYMWKHWDQSHSCHHPESDKYRNEFVRLWQKIDDIVGDVVKHCRADTYLLIISDHGFGPISQTFYTNKWLEENGFLVRKKSHAYINLKTKLLSKAAEIIRRVDEIFGTRFLRASKKFVNPVSRRYFDSFDLEKSSAIAARVSTVIEGIYVLDGNIKKELIEKLKNTKDTDGNLLNINVTEKEQVCKGKFAAEAPDLIITVNDLNSRILAHYNNHGSYFEKSVDANQTGSHRMDGMYIFTGPDVHATELELSLLDIAPTILYALDKSIPSEVDGKAATELFAKQIPPKFTKQAAGQDGPTGPSDQIEIENMLKSLGYM